MECKIKRFGFSSGERSALLVMSESGLPLMYQNLYMTIHHRNTGDSINTIIACLGALKMLEQIFEYLDVDIQHRFTKGLLLSDPELESIAYWSKKSIESLEEAKAIKRAKNIVQVQSKRIELSRFVVTIDSDLVSPITTYNRITHFSKYCSWLANTLAPSEAKKNIDLMGEKLLAFRPKKRTSQSDDGNDEGFMSLTENQIIRLLDVVRPDSSENPWKSKAVRYRNQMIVNLLYDVGCRKAELLNLKATDLDSGSNEIKIRRSADDANDPRKDQPLVKTMSRDVAVSQDVFTMIDDYVLYYRSNVKGAGRTSFLVLSHQQGASSASPLSISGLNKIFRKLSAVLGFNVNPHAFRHTWNDEFSAEVESLIEGEEMTEGEAEETRSYLMGWKEGSGTAKTYTKRYQKKKAVRFSLGLQEKRRSKVNEVVGRYDEDIDF